MRPAEVGRAVPLEEAHRAVDRHAATDGGLVEFKPQAGRVELRRPMLGLTQLSNYLTLKGSFSALSKPKFASKYALESSRRDLQNALLCTVLVGSVSKLNFLFENR